MHECQDVLRQWLYDKTVEFGNHYCSKPFNKLFLVFLCSFNKLFLFISALLQELKLVQLWFKWNHLSCTQAFQIYSCELLIWTLSWLLSLKWCNNKPIWRLFFSRGDIVEDSSIIPAVNSVSVWTKLYSRIVFQLFWESLLTQRSCDLILHLYHLEVYFFKLLLTLFNKCRPL